MNKYILLAILLAFKETNYASLLTGSMTILMLSQRILDLENIVKPLSFQAIVDSIKTSAF